MVRPNVKCIFNLFLLGAFFVLGVSLDEGEVETSAYDPSKAKYPGIKKHVESLSHQNVLMF